MTDENNNPENEESNIVLEQRERQKRKESTHIVIDTHEDHFGESDRYDLGGDEWINSLSGEDTWFNRDEHRPPGASTSILPKQQAENSWKSWKSGAD